MNEIEKKEFRIKLNHVMLGLHGHALDYIAHNLKFDVKRYHKSKVVSLQNSVKAVIDGYHKIFDIKPDGDLDDGQQELVGLIHDINERLIKYIEQGRVSEFRDHIEKFD